MVNVRVTRMAREQIATLLYAGATPVAYSNDFGFKVFMDARRLVTPEEWGSLPPKAARFLCPCILSGRGPAL